MSHFVVAVFGRGLARITTTSNIDGLFRQWRRRYGIFLPVVAVSCDPGLQISFTGGVVTTEFAALHLYRGAVDPSAQQAVFRQIHKLGAAAGPLLDEWRRAVDSVKGVGV